MRSSSWKLQLLFGWTALFFSSLAFAQPIPVSLPDTSGNAGTSVTIPIQVGDLTGREVLTYFAVVLFDPDVIQATSASRQGTLSEGIGSLNVEIQDGFILAQLEQEVAATPLAGSGVLLNLNFDVVGQPGGKSDLEFAGFGFNTGIPPVERTPGTFTIIVPTEPDIRIEPLFLDFGTVPIDSTALRSLTVLNEGTAELTVSAANLVGLDADQFGLENGNVLFKVSPSDSQNLVVSFTPRDVGEQNAFLEILSNDADEDTVRVALTGVAFETLQFQAKISAPDDGADVCPDSVTVEVVATVSGGVPPVAVSCEVNGIPAVRTNDRFVATLPVVAGDNAIVAVCRAVDDAGMTLVSRDSVTVTVAAPPTCAVAILSPMDGAIVSDETITVSGFFNISGGQRPFTIDGMVNGVPAVLSGINFSATVALIPGENVLVVTSTITDSCGNETFCSDSVRVFRELGGLNCDVEITSPAEGSFVCSDSIEVSAVTSIEGGILPITIDCRVNGLMAVTTDSGCVTKVPATNGENRLVIECVVTDGAGNQATCRDTVNVFVDTTPPTCSFVPRGLSIVGSLVDVGSGIASIRPLDLRNATLTVDDFTEGDKSVGFKIDIVNLSRPFGFNIEVVDVCGNRYICDPIFLSLSADQPNRQIKFTFPRIDQYLQLTNHGLTEIRIDLNGERFSLVANPALLGNNNVYLMPQEGEITIDLGEQLHAGENDISISYDGPSGTSAEFLLINEVDQVDFVLRLTSVPKEFQLAQNYPNPFNPTTRIQFAIPNTTGGIRVRLAVYNLIGELVRVLVDEEKASGQYIVDWNGTHQTGLRVSSGIYLLRFTAGEFQNTKRMILLR